MSTPDTGNTDTGSTDTGSTDTAPAVDQGPAPTIEDQASKALLATMEGEVALADGAKLTVPLYAVPASDQGSQVLQFSIARLADAPEAPAGEVAASALYMLGPAAVTFARPIAITLPVTGTPTPEQVRVYRVDPVTHKAVRQSGAYDPATSTVTTQAVRFSRWFVTTAPSDPNEKLSGAFQLANEGTAGWLTMCVKGFKAKFPEQQTSQPTNTIAAAPGGSTIGWASTVEWYVPQGTYELCIEYQTKGTVSQAPGAPEHIVLADQVLDQPWTASKPEVKKISYGTLPDAVAGPCDCTPSATGGVRIFDNGNVDAVQNAPSVETQFKTDRCYVITSMFNYHWNNGQGATPGKVGFKSASKTYGPWQATGAPGQGGVQDAYWYVYPGIKLPAGLYTITDSDTDTWATNFGTGGAGMSSVFGVPCP